MEPTPPFHILIADDDPSSCLILSGFLRKQGFQVAVANNGTSAWEMLQQTLPQVLLMDVMMPGLSGVEVLERLQCNNLGRDMNIFMITGRDSAEEINQMRALGATEVLNKPIDIKSLLERLNRLRPS